MRIDKGPDGSRERKILRAMITDDLVLGRIVTHWDGRLFSSPQANQIAEWCIEHYKKYSLAPKNAIESYLEIWMQTETDRASSKLLETLLSSIVQDGYESTLNSDFTIDTATLFFTEIRLERLLEGIRNDLEIGKPNRAEERISKYSRIEMSSEAGINIYHDKEEVLSTFLKRSRERLIDYEGGLDIFFANELEREGFVSFCGPQKVGKSAWLIDMAFRAVLQKRRVAFFEIGDFSKRQIKEKFLIRVAKHPTRSDNGRWPCTVKVPTDITFNGRTEKDEPAIAEVSFKERTFLKPLDGKRAWNACKRLNKEILRETNTYLQVSVHPNLSISVLGVKDIIDQWIREDWIPDIICIDYADNLAPVEKKEDPRHQINTTWKLLRAMAMQYHCLVITATQVKAAGFNKYILDRSDFSEDNRKLSHVSGMIGINRLAEEKKVQVHRLNWIVKREGDYDPLSCCHVGECLALANPAMVSCW